MAAHAGHSLLATRSWSWAPMDRLPGPASSGLGPNLVKSVPQEPLGADWYIIVTVGDRRRHLDLHPRPTRSQRCHCFSPGNLDRQNRAQVRRQNPTILPTQGRQRLHRSILSAPKPSAMPRHPSSIAGGHPSAPPSNSIVTTSYQYHGLNSADPHTEWTRKAATQLNGSVGHGPGMWRCFWIVGGALHFVVLRDSPSHSCCPAWTLGGRSFLWVASAYR